MLMLRYDRRLGQLGVTDQGEAVQVPAAALPPQATTLAPALSRFGEDVGLGVSLLVEYPERARSGRLEDVSAPPGGAKALHWVSYHSSLGYVVEVGLRGAALLPAEVVQQDGGTPLRVPNVFAAN
jgi:hypothetical protein